MICYQNKPEDSIGSILSPKEAGNSATDVTTITTIVAATVGAGVFLSILFNILLLTYKRRKKSDVVNIPIEVVDTPQEPLPNDQVNQHPLMYMCR